MSTHHEAITPPAAPNRVQAWWSRQRRAEKIALVACAVVGAFLVVGALNTLLHSDPAPRVQPAPPASAADKREAAKPVSTDRQSANSQPCSQVDPNATGRVTCQATSATLQIAHGDVPVLLDGLQARVMNTAVVGDDLTVRLRVRNTTSKPQVFDVPGRQTYGMIGGRRAFATGAATPLQPDEAKFVMLTFALSGPAAEEAEIAILPFGKKLGPRPQDMGVVKVSLPGA